MIPIRYCYADQFGGQKGKKFKYKQLEELLFTKSHLPLKEIKNKIKTINRILER
jgi:predicted nucleotidyltransferase